jgi:hypothetical protein
MGLLFAAGLAQSAPPAASYNGTNTVVPSLATLPVYPAQTNSDVPQRLDVSATTELAPPPGPIWQAAYQGGMPPGGGGAPLGESPESFPIRLEPPPMRRVAQAGETDEALFERMRQEYRERHIGIVFPEGPVLSTDTYQGREFEARKMLVAPNYVIYRRLYFQQINFERYGWDLGPITPILSAGTFFLDFALLPYHLGTDPCRCIDSNAGYCLPGDPVPLLLYPPELSLTGAAAEVGAILTLVAIFP